MQEIFPLDTLAQLQKFIGTQPPDKLRPKLQREFLKYCIYKNAEQWNRAVRLCEALAIIGWGDLEPVEAIGTKFWNGNPQTFFLNRHGQRRFLSTIWSKRKAGLTPDPDPKRCSYYASPDLPDRPHDNHDFRMKLDIQDIRLNTQRNWIPKNPILVRRSCLNCCPDSEEFNLDVEHVLQPMLNQKMRPEHYGTAVSTVFFEYYLSSNDRHVAYEYHVVDDDKPLTKGQQQQGLKNRFKYSPFRASTGLISANIYYPLKFSQQSTLRQKKELAGHLLTALDAIAARLTKRKIPYDTQRLKTDFAAILNEWCATDSHNFLLSLPESKNTYLFFAKLNGGRAFGMKD